MLDIRLLYYVCRQILFSSNVLWIKKYSLHCYRKFHLFEWSIIKTAKKSNHNVICHPTVFSNCGGAAVGWCKLQRSPLRTCCHTWEIITFTPAPLRKVVLSELGGGRGIWPLHILADQLILGGQIMPTTLLLTPPDFQTFLWPCKRWHLTTGL